jgi:hypothetical protein
MSSADLLVLSNGPNILKDVGRGDSEARSPETDKADRIVRDAALRGEIDEANS